MFIVFNRSKINSYLISLGTVIILFVMAFFITTGDSVETAASMKELPIYNVAIEEKRLAFTMNCAWNADDIDSILDTLSKYKVHITFFMVGDFVDKYRRCSKKNIRCWS